MWSMKPGAKLARKSLRRRLRHREMNRFLGVFGYYTSILDLREFVTNIPMTEGGGDDSVPPHSYVDLMGKSENHCIRYIP